MTKQSESHLRESMNKDFITAAVVTVLCEVLLFIHKLT